MTSPIPPFKRKAQLIVGIHCRSGLVSVSVDFSARVARSRPHSPNAATIDRLGRPPTNLRVVGHLWPANALVIMSDRTRIFGNRRDRQ